MTKSKRMPRRAVQFVADGNFAIHVTDLKKAEKFYSSVLGFKLLKETKAQLVYKTGKITLYVNKDDKVIPFVPALQVEDYNKAKQHLTKNRCTVTKEWPKSKALYFEDPFGITIDIIQE